MVQKQKFILYPNKRMLVFHSLHYLTSNYALILGGVSFFFMLKFKEKFCCFFNKCRKLHLHTPTCQGCFWSFWWAFYAKIVFFIVCLFWVLTFSPQNAVIYIGQHVIQKHMMIFNLVQNKISYKAQEYNDETWKKKSWRCCHFNSKPFHEFYSTVVSYKGLYSYSEFW